MHNQKEGKGIFTWKNANEYRGDFVAGLMCGKGEMKYGEGHRYVGDWKDNKKHGFGVFTYFKGHVYAGEWIGEFFMRVFIVSCVAVVGFLAFFCLVARSCLKHRSTEHENRAQYG